MKKVRWFFALGAGLVAGWLATQHFNQEAHEGPGSPSLADVYVALSKGVAVGLLVGIITLVVIAIIRQNTSSDATSDVSER